MAAFVGKELLLSKLDHLSFLMEYFILILICDPHNLVVLLENDLWTFDLSMLVEVR